MVFSASEVGAKDRQKLIDQASHAVVLACQYCFFGFAI